MKNKINEKKAVIESVTLPVIRGYKNMIEHLFHHILDNALKFQDENNIPQIIINCEQVVGEREEKNELLPGQEYLKISFQDNGIGFHPEDSVRIFNLFEKLNDRKFHGSGVGLTIARKIVEAHDGFIEAKSSPGKGSVFSCYFPIETED